jgi:hypothetical protein
VGAVLLLALGSAALGYGLVAGGGTERPASPEGWTNYVPLAEGSRRDAGPWLAAGAALVAASILLLAVAVRQRSPR